VTGEAYYNRHFRGLEYPGQNSGPTGGIGSDFGTQRREQIEADWRGHVSDAEMKILLGAAGVRGDKAAAYVRRYGHAVRYPFRGRTRCLRRARPAALSGDPRALLP
jgi:hypothetical protein